MQDIFIVRGGRPLEGNTEARGSKNAASKMMIASLLTEESCVIENIPLSGEIDITQELCRMIGSRVELSPEHRCTIHTPRVENSRVVELTRRNRIPVLAIGPLLHRTGVAEVPTMGGDKIGHRPINFHIAALQQMGVSIELRDYSYYATAREIHGAEITLPYPSVGATENIILTAVRANGTTMIHNSAIEPEIMNLIQMLQSMGAEIKSKNAERFIEIKGVKKLHGTTASVMPDRNEIVSFAAAALATRGNILIRADDLQKENLSAFLEKISEAGGSYVFEPRGVRFIGSDSYQPLSVETAPHPGFMTDWQQPFAVLLTQAEGTSTIHETVYEDRFGYLKDLSRMGAHIEMRDSCPDPSCRYASGKFTHLAKINGPTLLHGASIEMCDIRAGMAHIIAALSAHGESRISGVEHIDRGYEGLDERLRELGADIKRIPNS